MGARAVGVGTSHGPMLSTSTEEWAKRAEVDQKNKELMFEGKVYAYPELLELRGSPELEQASTVEAQLENEQRCHVAAKGLADRWAAAGVTRAIIFGNDHKELFDDQCFGAITIYAGNGVMQVPFDASNVDLLAHGTREARHGHTPDIPVTHPTDAKFADELIEYLNGEGFDIARSVIAPPGRYSNRSMPHAYGYVYRQVMDDKVPPHVPVFINTFYPPNVPLPARCVELGRAVGRRIKEVGANEPDGCTAVIGSGGLSHFVVEEAFDKMILDALATGDLDKLAAIDPDWLRSGNSEIRSWIALGGAMHELGLTMELVDYVPCYRSPAGTGCGMGFVFWQ